MSAEAPDVAALGAKKLEAEKDFNLVGLFLASTPQWPIR
jgi:hypothetical protein